MSNDQDTSIRSADSWAMALRQQKYAEKMHLDTNGAVTSRELERVDAAIGVADEEMKGLREDNKALRESERILQKQIDEQAKEIDRLREEIRVLGCGNG